MREKIKHGRSTNMLLGEDLSITYNTNPYNKKKIPSNGLGWLHTLVVGTTGTGKSRYYVKPNIYSLPTDPLTGRAISMVITDPKGELLNDCGLFLKEHGYEVRVFNLFEMEKSDCYNPFAYVRSQQDIAVQVVGAIVENMTLGKEQGDHWSITASYVITSVCSYVYYELQYKEANLTSVATLLATRYATDDRSSVYDSLMEALEEEKGADHPAVMYYHKITARGDELGSILSTASKCLGVFAQRSIQIMTNTDSLELNRIGDRPTALFVVTPPDTKVFNFLVSLMYSQLFTVLSKKANIEYKNDGQTLPHKVWMILDEFANSGKIPDFDTKITLLRSVGIFCSIIVQAPSQIEALYEKTAGTIMSNCSITLFLGAPGNTLKDDSAANFISKNLDFKTIRTESYSLSYQGGTRIPQMTTSVQAQKRELMTPSEVKQMEADKCIILLGGQFPIITKKRQCLETCMNYDIAREIKEKNPPLERRTEDTYQLGRSLSDKIEKEQDMAREEELKVKRIFEEIDQKERKEEEIRRVEEIVRESVKSLSKTPNIRGICAVPLKEAFREEELTLRC